VQVISLRLYQFRNFDLEEIEFCPGTNLLFGQNGQGKTNLLEAVYFLGYGRSFRTVTPKDCVRHGQQECRVDGLVAHGGLTRELCVSLFPRDDKRLFLHRKPAVLAEFIGNLHVLAFTQEHLKVVRGGPGERRAFLDRAMLAVFPGHMHRLAAYGRALLQRNRLLASSAAGRERIDLTLLESWEEKLVQEGSRILFNRRLHVDDIRREFCNPFCEGENIEIYYKSTASPEGRNADQVEDEFRQRIRKARKLDERRGFTSVGPHRDDMVLLLNGKALADFGSAGQQRSCLLSLYFAQMEIHRKTCGFYPVFLMDDVEAELDDLRLQSFLDHLGLRTQTILTSAKGHVLPDLGINARKFRVHEGRIHAASG
jgi:DNA replication and repair protein RecF